MVEIPRPHREYKKGGRRLRKGGFLVPDPFKGPELLTKYPNTNVRQPGLAEQNKRAA